MLKMTDQYLNFKERIYANVSENIKITMFCLLKICLCIFSRTIVILFITEVLNDEIFPKITESYVFYMMLIYPKVCLRAYPDTFLK